MTFRDDRPVCPHCTDERPLSPQPHAPTRLACEGCRGVLIPTAEIEDVIADFQHGPFRFPDGVPGDRQCPCCVATLARFELFGMPLDRCEVHGVWFDARELVHVLEAATGVEPRSITDADKPPSTGLRRLLDRLFSHRWDYKRPRD